MPDQAQPGSSAETLNTGSTAGSQITGSGQAPQPAASGGAQDDRQHWISLGMALGTEKTLKKLELGDDITAAVQTVYQMRQPKPKPGKEPTQQGQAGTPATDPDISEHPKYKELLGRFTEFEDKYGKLDKQVTTLQAQADEARVEKLKSAALGKGVGAGKQLDAFVHMYGSRVVWGPNRELVVIGPRPDGSIGMLPKKLDEFLDEALAESRFLLAPGGAAQARAAGPGPTRSPDEAPKTAEAEHRTTMRGILGPAAGGSSQSHRFFERRKG